MSIILIVLILVSIILSSISLYFLLTINTDMGNHDLDMKGHSIYDVDRATADTVTGNFTGNLSIKDLTLDGNITADKIDVGGDLNSTDIHSKIPLSNIEYEDSINTNENKSFKIENSGYIKFKHGNDIPIDYRTSEVRLTSDTITISGKVLNMKSLRTLGTNPITFLVPPTLQVESRGRETTLTQWPKHCFNLVSKNKKNIVNDLSTILFADLVGYTCFHYTLTSNTTVQLSSSVVNHKIFIVITNPSDYTLSIEYNTTGKKINNVTNGVAESTSSSYVIYGFVTANFSYLSNVTVS